MNDKGFTTRPTLLVCPENGVVVPCLWCNDDRGFGGAALFPVSILHRVEVLVPTGRQTTTIKCETHGIPLVAAQ